MTIFPIKAKDLVERACQVGKEESDQVRLELTNKLLPRTVEIILTSNPSFKSSGAPRNQVDEMVQTLSQILWSHAGSMGGVRIEQTLLRLGFNLDEADSIATDLVRFSRLTMSVVNHLRHVESALTGISEFINADSARARYLAFKNLKPNIEKKWLDYIEELAYRKLNNGKELAAWLKDVENAMSDLLKARNLSELSYGPTDIGPVVDEIFNGSAGMALAYTRRFGRFVYSKFNIEGLGSRYETDEDYIQSEIQKLKDILSQDAESVFALFKEDYEKRRSRIKVSTTPPSSRLKSFETSKSIFEQYITYNLKLDGRDLIVKSTSDNLSKDLIQQMYKLFKMQVELDPKGHRFEGKTSRDGQTLIVELQRPKASDIEQMKKRLFKMFTE